MTRNQLISLGQKVSSKFRRTPSFSFILGAIDTEAPGEDGEKVKKRVLLMLNNFFNYVFISMVSPYYPG